MVMLVNPRVLAEFIVATPSIVENSRSSGVAIDAAIVSAEAPGRLAETSTVGKSTFGSGLTGRPRYARRPNASIATITSVVATGLRMNGAERFIGSAMTPRLEYGFARPLRRAHP